MVAIELDPDHQRRLDETALAQGQDAAALARQIIADYLDFQALRNDAEEDWAEASIALTPEVMTNEKWGGPRDGSK